MLCFAASLRGPCLKAHPKLCYYTRYHVQEPEPKTAAERPLRQPSPTGRSPTNTLDPGPSKRIAKEQQGATRKDRSSRGSQSTRLPQPVTAVTGIYVTECYKVLPRCWHLSNLPIPTASAVKRLFLFFRSRSVTLLLLKVSAATFDHLRPPNATPKAAQKSAHIFAKKKTKTTKTNNEKQKQQIWGPGTAAVARDGG